MSINSFSLNLPTVHPQSSQAENAPTPTFDHQLAVRGMRRITRKLSRAIPRRPNPTGLDNHLGMFSDYRPPLLNCLLWAFLFITFEVAAGYVLHSNYVQLTYLLMATGFDLVLVILFFPLEMDKQEIEFRQFYEDRRTALSGNKKNDLRKKSTRKGYKLLFAQSVILVVAGIKIYLVMVTQELGIQQIIPVMLAYAFTAFVNLRYMGRLFYLLAYWGSTFWPEKKTPEARCKVLALESGVKIKPVLNNGGHNLKVYPDGSACLTTFDVLTAEQLDYFLKNQTDDRAVDAISMAGMDAQLSSLS